MLSGFPQQEGMTFKVDDEVLILTGSKHRTDLSKRFQKENADQEQETQD